MDRWTDGQDLLAQTITNGGHSANFTGPRT